MVAVFTSPLIKFDLFLNSMIWNVDGCGYVGKGWFAYKGRGFHH
jgi:hypothetical protein